jgi:hypothetical protein
MARGTRVKQIEERLDKIRRDIELLRAQEELLVDMIREAEGRPPELLSRARAARSTVKKTVLDLLSKVKENGINATMAVAMAEDEYGVRLERGTVSSLLSRLKHEGVVTYVNEMYRLKEHSLVEAKPAASIHPLRASGEAP